MFTAGFEASRLTVLSRRCLTAAGTCARGERFRVDVDWRDFAGQEGAAGFLDAVGDSSRVFWFFEQNNWEMMVKVLDGCGINDHFWVFAAGITDVATSLRVTDTWTGRRWSSSSGLGQASVPVTDTRAFATCEAEAPAGWVSQASSSVVADGAEPSPISGGCGGPGLCFRDRFYVRVEWWDYDGNTGVGQVVPIDSRDSGLLWFFDPDNWEMMVKVLDGCEVNGRAWVFAAATTDVGTRLTVIDRFTGEQKVYESPLGVAAPAITDTDAFDLCLQGG